MTSHELPYPHTGPVRGRYFVFATATLTPPRVPENFLANTYRDSRSHGVISPEFEADR